MKDKTLGYWNVILSLLMWGILPVYWKAMLEFPASDILAHRIIWSFLFLSILLSYHNSWKDFFKNFSSVSEIIFLSLRASFLGINWFIYVWGINHDHVVDCSLGYFIMPLVIVLMSFIFLKEKLSKLEIISFLLALAGVLNLILSYGKFPWLALSLAITFAIYAVFRKTSKHGPISGLAAEVALLSIPAFSYLLFSGTHNNWLYYSNISFLNLVLILGTGIVTVVPLLCYIHGIKRVKLNIAGMLNYISPTCNFLLGIFLYKETFSFIYFITFAMIWISIIIFSYDSIKRTQKSSFPK